MKTIFLQTIDGYNELTIHSYTFTQNHTKEGEKKNDKNCTEYIMH